MSDPGDSNILFELRETARLLPESGRKGELKQVLKEVADLLAGALEALIDTPTTTKMQLVNGLWSKSVRLLKSAESAKPGGSGGALKEGAKLAA
jgi:hypothetical protein